MCCSSKGHPGQKLAGLLIVVGLFVSSESVLTLSCWADAPPLPSVPKKISWVSGPAKVEVGGLAQARILEGFRFADAENARIVLDTTHTAVPEGLLGVISPASGEYYVLLQFNETGYLRDASKQPLEEDAILKTVWDRTTRQNAKRVQEGSPNIVHVEWVLKPTFDANSRLLECAIRTDGRADNSSLVNYTLQRLGRRGVLQASVVKQRRDFSDFGIVREAIRAITFKPGEDYRDYKEGDKLATATVAELIMGENSPTGSFLVSNTASTVATASTSGFRAVWIGLGVIGCVGIAGTVMLARRLRQYRASQPGQAESVAQRGAKSRNGSPRLKLDVRSKTPKPNYHAQNGNGNGNGTKRRRMFNYHKFYTEMVLQGPSPSVSEPMPGFNGVNGYNGYNGYNGHNGYGNGHNGNGNGNGAESANHVEATPASTNGAGANMLSAHSEFIASQMSLIEEQKRLIHEQARLIEEKSRLIAEKNQLLERQSQMIDNNLL